jgi:hypothetical protein
VLGILSLAQWGPYRCGDDEMVGATRVVQHVGEMNLDFRLRRRDFLWICMLGADASMSARPGYPRQLRVDGRTRTAMRDTSVDGSAVGF